MGDRERLRSILLVLLLATAPAPAQDLRPAETDDGTGEPAPAEPRPDRADSAPASTPDHHPPSDPDRQGEPRPDKERAPEGRPAIRAGSLPERTRSTGLEAPAPAPAPRLLPVPKTRTAPCAVPPRDPVAAADVRGGLLSLPPPA